MGFFYYILSNDFFIDIFYRKGPEKANEQELQGKFKEATKKTRINMLHFELSGKTLKSNSPTIKE